MERKQFKRGYIVKILAMPTGNAGLGGGRKEVK